ncbi:TIGR00159 family protein, partial [bacterium]|nr:TIGR00159 family protein [bacterium]
MEIAKGLLFLVSVLIICRFLNLRTVRWLVQTALYGIVVALPIVFQPELRRMLVSLGSGSGFTNSLKRLTEMTNHIQSVDGLMWAIEQLCETKTGALIVIERQTGLDDY